MSEAPYIIDREANLLTIRDPMIAVVDDTYYLTGSQMPYWKGVNDGVHLWSSKDLKSFTYHGLILSRTDIPEELWCRDRFWAPEVFDGKDGWFYLTVSCRNETEEHHAPFGVALARARQITGPYELVSRDAPLSSGIDGTIFRDDDGKFYIGHANRYKLYLDEFDPETATVIQSHLVCESGAEGEWDFIGIEGQCVVKRHGIYFQWYSSWTDNQYRAGILTAPSITGPWTKSPANPVLTGNHIWTRGGHNHSFRGLDGKDYIIFHGQEANLTGPMNFERMYIREVIYKPDGTVEIPLD